MTALPPKVAIDAVPVGNLRQVNHKSARSIDNLPHLPICQIGVGRHASEVIGDLVRRQRRRDRRLDVLQEILDPPDAPLPERRRNLTTDQEIQVTVPVRRQAVITAWWYDVEDP